MALFLKQDRQGKSLKQLLLLTRSIKIKNVFLSPHVGNRKKVITEKSNISSREGKDNDITIEFILYE